MNHEGWVSFSVLVFCLLTAALDQANNGHELTLLAVTVSVALIGLVAAAARRPAAGQWPVGAAGALLLALVGWSALAILWSRVPYLSIIDLTVLGTVVITYAAWRIATVPEAPRPLPVVGWGLLVAGLAMAAVMAGQFFTGHRPTALFLNPNSAAALVNLLWPAVAVAWLAGAGRLLGTPRAQQALLPALFVLVFAVGLDGGRAAFLAAATALAVVLGGSAYALGAGRRRLAAVALVFVGALLAAYLVNVLGLGTGRLLGERIASLGSPDEAGAVRFLQWAATWELIREAPWLGLGPGVFWLAYAAVRPAGDGTAGMFAHNDYLHFWAERGLPAPLLVLAVGGVCVYLFVRAVRAGRIGALDPASAAGAIAAFAAVAGLGLHGLFSYQLQLASMLIPAFLLIAELERLAPARPLAVLRLPDWRRPLTLTAGAGALALVVFSVGLIGSAQRATEAGIEDTRSGDYEAAERAFLTAQRRWGWADPPWLHHAELYQRLLAQVPAAEAELRRELMAEAMRLLDTARDRNPLRAQIPTLRGELRRDYPELTEGSPRAAFRRALALNPRAVSARLAYARLLRREEGDEAARAVLEAGVELRYGQKAAPLPLYQVTAEARSATGDPEGAAAMRERIESLRERLRRESGD